MLTLEADGDYTYSISNADVQYLDAGQSRTETFTVTSADGTAKQISFTTNGAKDDPLDSISVPQNEVWLLDAQYQQVGTAYTTIQAAINAASAGYFVVVGQGSYAENLSITKDITLVSNSGAASTTIVGQGTAASGSITLNGAAGATIGAVGRGFTIVGIDSASAGVEASAIALKGAVGGITIEGNIVQANGEAAILGFSGTTGTGLTIRNNTIGGQTFTGDYVPAQTWSGSYFSTQFTTANIPRQLVTINASGSLSEVVFTDNLINGTAGGSDGNGNFYGNTLVTIDAPSSTISNNTFEGETYGSAALRSRGENSTVTDNTFSWEGDATSIGFTTNKATTVASGNTFAGDASDNLILGTPGADLIDGKGGSDTVSYQDATAAVSVDLVAGLGGISGSNVFDTLTSIENATGGLFNDTISGTDQANVVAGGAGSDSLSGGEGVDTLSFADVAAATVDLAAGTATSGTDTDTFTSFENVTGSASGDNISGDAGANLLSGGAGDDVLSGRLGSDTLDGGSGLDVADYGYIADQGVAVNLSSGGFTNGDDQDTFTSIEGLYGSNQDDTLTGDAGSNVIMGRDGADSLDGGDGLDTLSYAYATQNASVNLLTGLAQVGDAADLDTLANFENVLGGVGNDTLIGNALDNVFDAAAGADSMDGGEGSDLYVYASPDLFGTGESIADTGLSGTDEIRFTSTTAGRTLALSNVSGVEKVVIGTAAGVTTGTTALNVDASGLSGDLTIVGNAGANNLAGGSGAESLEGGLGNDTLTAGAGNDTLNGGTGADSMDGGDGSDLYLIASTTEFTSDTLSDSGTSGNDELRITSASTGTYTLAASMAGIESVVVGTGTGASADTSATMAINVSAANVAYGVALTGNDGANALTGSAFADTLSGGGGTDTLTGGAGADSMDGGEGADIYVIAAPGDFTMADSTTDTINDNGLSGTDEIRFTSGTASQTLTLSNVSGIEKVLIGTAAGVTTGTVALNVDASALSGGLTMVGNAGVNALTGTSGADSIEGGNGADTLSGGAGNDTLNGGAGGDSMDGGAGNDLYLIGSVTDLTSDVISDAGGTDQIRLTAAATGTYTFAASLAGIESVVIGTGAGASVDTTATTAINVSAANVTYGLAITGNDGANSLTGSTSADTLAGGGGADTLIGGSGADSLTGGDGADTLTGGADADSLNGGDGADVYIIAAPADFATGETIADSGASGTDEIRFTSATTGQTLTLTDVTGVEKVLIGTAAGLTTGTTALSVDASGLSDNLSIVGNAGANTLKAGTGTDSLEGGGGADSLNGGDGNDSLNGGAGNDTLFGGNGSDYFVFSTALSSNIDTISDFAQGTDKLLLDDAIFTALTAEGLANAIGSTLIYNSTTGALSYDADGSGAGAAVQFATLTIKPSSLTGDDFQII